MKEKPVINDSYLLHPVSEIVLDQVNALIYISRLDTYEILYMNSQAQQLYGDCIGKVCWQWLQKDLDKPCAFCAINFLDGDYNKEFVYIRDRYNPRNDKWYEVHDCIIDWHDGAKAKLQIAYNIDHRKKDEKKLRILHKQQELYAKIATTFNMARPYAYKLNEVLGQVGTFVDVSRVSLFEITEGKQHPILTYEWCKKGVKPKLNKLRELVFNTELPSYERLINREYINIEDLNISSQYDLFSIFRKFDVCAMLFIPIFLHDMRIGYITFEVCNKTRTWKKDEIKILKTFGNIISTFLERKSIDEKRIRSEMSLKKANATKDKFFSVISRDLLAPFSSLISLSSMLYDNYGKWKDDKRLLFVNSIRESSKQGYKLLENLITWSKIQSGVIEYFPSEIDLGSAINLAIEQLTENITEKNLSINKIPQQFIFAYADYHMIHSVIKNILSNAVKFSPENGKIQIELVKNEEFVEVAVTDKGKGIEKTYISSLFKIDRFSTEYGPTDEKGTGLGLIICREFVEKNGGKIWAESKLGKGSRFTFTIPLCKT